MIPRRIMLAPENPEVVTLIEQINDHIVAALQGVEGEDLDPALVGLRVDGFSCSPGGVAYNQSGEPVRQEMTFESPSGKKLRYVMEKTWVNGFLTSQRMVDPNRVVLGTWRYRYEQIGPWFQLSNVEFRR